MLEVKHRWGVRRRGTCHQMTEVLCNQLTLLPTDVFIYSFIHSFPLPISNSGWTWTTRPHTLLWEYEWVPLFIIIITLVLTSGLYDALGQLCFD